MLFSWGFLLCCLLSYGFEGTQSLYVAYGNGIRYIELKDGPNGVYTKENKEVGYSAHTPVTGRFFMMFDLSSNYGGDQKGSKEPKMMQKRSEEVKIQGAKRPSVVTRLKQGEEALDKFIDMLDA